MKIFAGARGAGKTYKLAHVAMEDARGVFVTQTPEMRDWTEQEYPELAGRIVSREQVGGVSPLARLYIDGIRSGDDLGWADKWPIGGLAVSPVNDFAPVEGLSEAYMASLKEKYFREGPVDEPEVPKNRVFYAASVDNVVPIVGDMWFDVNSVARMWSGTDWVLAQPELLATIDTGKLNIGSISADMLGSSLVHNVNIAELGSQIIDAIDDAAQTLEDVFGKRDENGKKKSKKDKKGKKNK